MSDVIQVIAEHAFSASPYPLIISLEVHCSLAQQQTLATLLQQGSPPRTIQPRPQP